MQWLVYLFLDRNNLVLTSEQVVCQNSARGKLLDFPMAFFLSIKLYTFRKEGVLIILSGNKFHRRKKTFALITCQKPHQNVKNNASCNDLYAL